MTDMNALLKTITTAALCAGFAFAPSAIAGETNGDLMVSVHVVASCRLKANAASLSFGNVEQGAGSANASTDMDLRCSNHQPYAIGFDYGQHSEGAQRRMSDGSNGIAYQLYADAAHTKPLGPHGSDGEMRGIGTGDDQQVPVYGKLDLDRDTPTGSYSDVVRMTVTW